MDGTSCLFCHSQGVQEVSGSGNSILLSQLYTGMLQQIFCLDMNGAFITQLEQVASMEHVQCNCVLTDSVSSLDSIHTIRDISFIKRQVYVFF